METVSAAKTTHQARHWWESPWFLAVVVAATMVPLLYPPIPPLVDLFGHMGRYRVELDLGHSPWLRQYFDYHWAAIGNLGVDILVLLLGPIVGLEPAVKLIVLLIPPLTAIGFLWVSREVHGRVPPSAFLALPFIYGFPFLFGFVNFTLSVAFAFLAFGLWLRLGRLDRTVVREWVFVPISLVVFFTHTYGWGLLGLMCFSAEAVAVARPRAQLVARRTRSRASHLGHGPSRSSPCSSGAARRTAARPMAGSNWKMKWRWIYGALRDRWKLLDIWSLVIAAAVFVYAIFNRFFGHTLTLSRNLVFSAIVLAVSFLILPRIVFGSAYADMRLVPYLMAVAILAIRYRGPEHRKTAQYPRGDRPDFLRHANRREHDQPRHGRPTTRRRSSAPSTPCPREPA